MPAEPLSRDWNAELTAALEGAEATALADVLADMPAPDLAERFLELEEADRQAILEMLNDEQVADLLVEMESDDQEVVLDLLTLERATAVIEAMYSDDAADLLAELPIDEADALLERMEPEAAEDVADLMRYPEDTAGGLMAKEYVRVAPDDRVEEVLAVLRRHQDDAEMIYYLYVLDEEERLLGVVNIRQLIVSAPGVEMAAIMAREFASVATDLPRAEVAELVRRHDLLAVPVMSEDGRMQGIITVDDISAVVQEEAADDLLEISGAEEADEPAPTWRGWRSGGLALAGGALMGLILWAFSGFLGEVWRGVTAATPLLMVLAITVGSQAALAMDHAYDSPVERHQLPRMLLREALAGLLMALLGAGMTALLVLALRQSADLLLPMSVAMLAGVWAAAVVSALGVMVARRDADRLGSTAYTVIIILALIPALLLYLALALGLHQSP